MAEKEYPAINALLHSPKVVAMITQIANELCATANAMYPAPRGDGENFAVVVQNLPDSRRPRAYVRPVGRTGIRVEQGQSVLLKSIPAMLGAYPGLQFKTGSVTLGDDGDLVSTPETVADRAKKLDIIIGRKKSRRKK